MTTPVRPTETAFLRLDGRVGWRASGLGEGLIEDLAAGGLRLGSEGERPIPAAEPYGSLGGETLARGLTITGDGHVLLADPYGHQILHYIPPFAEGGRPAEAPSHWPFRPLWTPPPAPAPLPEHALPAAAPAPPPHRLAGPRDLAIGPDGDLVVADTGNGRLVVLSWPGLAARRIVPIPGGSPVAVAFAADGRTYVADAAGARVWRYDRLWRLDPGYAGGQGSLAEPAQVAIGAAGEVLVLDAAQRRVHLLDGRGRLARDAAGEPLATLGLAGRDLPPPLALDEGGLRYPQPARPRCPALRLPGVEVDRLGRLQGTLLPLLARPGRLSLPRRGHYLSERLDGGQAGWAWHRVVIDSEVPAATQLLVQTYTSEVPLELARIAGLDEQDWSPPLAIGERDRPEVLVQSPPGRYLWLRIELGGDGKQTPVLRAIEVQAPRASSLAWLPPVFREDPAGADFLDRYLSYFDTVFAEVSFQVRDFARLLDPYGVPPGELLDWLGAWFDWRFLADWPEPVRREMIAQAVGFFRERGTLAGMRRLLQWHTGLSGDQPAIIEHFRLRDYATRRGGGGAGLVDGRLYLGGAPLEPPPGQIAHWFTVVVPEHVVPDAAAHAALERLIEAQRPAHTAFQVRVLRPGLRIGCQSSIGIDTWLGGYSSEPLGATYLGRSARLSPDRPPSWRLGETLLSGAEGSCS